MKRIILAAVAAVALSTSPALAQSAGPLPPPTASWVKLFEQVAGPDDRVDTRPLFDAAFLAAPRQGEYLQYNQRLYRVVRVNHFLTDASARLTPVEDHLTAIVVRCASVDTFC